MMPISICIPMLFQTHSIKEGLREASKTGIKNVEIMRWYGEDLQEVKQVKESLGLNVVMLSTKPYNLVDPSQHDLFLNGLQRSIEAANLLDCENLVCISGDEWPDEPRDVQMKNLITILDRSAAIVGKAGITLNIEPINIKVDHPNQFLYRSAEAFEIVKKINNPHLKVLFDIYHQQITEGDLSRGISENIEWIGHFHAAGNPGRHEITEGEINYRSIFNCIKGTGYNGYIGLEYKPLKDPVTSIREIQTTMA